MAEEIKVGLKPGTTFRLVKEVLISEQQLVLIRSGKAIAVITAEGEVDDKSFVSFGVSIVVKDA